MDEAKKKECVAFNEKYSQLDDKERGVIICMLPPQDKAGFIADKFLNASDEIKKKTLDAIDGFLRVKK